MNGKTGEDGNSFLRRMSLIGAGFVATVLVLALQWMWLSARYDEYSTELKSDAMERAEEALLGSLELAFTKFDALQGLYNASLNVSEAEMLRFTDAVIPIGTTAAHRYVWISNRVAEPSIVIGDDTNVRSFDTGDMSPGVLAMVQRLSESGESDWSAFEGGVLISEAGEPGLVTMVRPVYLQNGELRGVLAITIGLNRISLLTDIGIGIYIPNIEVNVAGSDQSISAFGPVPTDDNLMIDVVFRGLHFDAAVEIPQVTLMSFVATGALNRYFLFLVALLIMAVTLVVNSKQVATTRAALKAARRAAEDSEATNYQRQRFMATMSHEMRTPLNGIIGMGDILRKSDLMPEQRKTVDVMVNSGENLLSLINQILDFSKIEAKEIEIDPQVVDLGELITEVANAVIVLLAEKPVELITNVPMQVCVPVEVDPLKLRQVITNLASNAIKFTSEGSVALRVHVLGQMDSGQLDLLFSVEDTGIGIAADRLDKIFQPFQQADASTTRQYGGTGLGLTITREIIEAMGGEIEVQSTEGVGSVFSFQVQMAADLTHRPLRRECCVLGIHNLLVFVRNDAKRAAILQMIQSSGAETSSATSIEEAREQIAAGFEAAAVIDLILVEDAEDARALSDYRNQVKGGHRIKIGILRSTQLANQPLMEDELESADLVLSPPHTAPSLVSGIAQALFHRGFSKIATPSAKVSKEEMIFPGLRVLLVDDDMVNQMYGNAVLSKLQCRVESAENGQEAIDMLGDGQDFDIVLLDCQMPVLDGYETVKQLKAKITSGQMRSIPIVALTANAQKSDREYCMQVGMDDFLSKPFRQEQLAEIINRWLPQSAARAEKTKGTTSTGAEEGASQSEDPTEAERAPAVTDEDFGFAIEMDFPDGLGEASDRDRVDLPDTGFEAEDRSAGRPRGAEETEDRTPKPVLKSIESVGQEPPLPIDNSATTAFPTSPTALLSDNGAGGLSETPETKFVAHPEQEIPVSEDAIETRGLKNSAPNSGHGTRAVNESSRNSEVDKSEVTPASTTSSQQDVMADSPEKLGEGDIEPYVPKAPLVDASALMATKDALGPAFSKLLQTYMNSSPKVLQTLPFDIDSRDFSTVQRNAHSLKSSSKMVGAMALAEVAYLLEEQCKKSSPSRRECLGLAYAMTESFKGYAESLRRSKEKKSA